MRSHCHGILYIYPSIVLVLANGEGWKDWEVIAFSPSNSSLKFISWKLKQKLIFFVNTVETKSNLLNKLYCIG
jgi:hypothetical protein